MRIGTTLAFLVAAGFAAGTAAAQDTAAVGGGEAAQRSPSTTPDDITNLGRRAPAIGSPGAGMTGPGVGRGGAYGLPATATFDEIFAAAAASSGIAEVTMATVANRQASSDEVKLFAQRMLADHTKANRELMALGNAKAIPLPVGLEIRDRADQAILMGLTGEQFDRAYVHQQLAAHMCAVALFKAEAARGADPQLRAWAAKTLPVLEEHKQHAKRMHDDMERTRPSPSPAPAPAATPAPAPGR